MSNEKTQDLIQKIALLLQQEEKGSDDSAFLRETLQKINSRLDQIESEISVQNLKSKVQSPISIHPSHEKIKFIEDFVDEIIVNHQIQKACMFETNKPCDNCSMCNSRGF